MFLLLPRLGLLWQLKFFRCKLFKIFCSKFLFILIVSKDLHFPVFYFFCFCDLFTYIFTSQYYTFYEKSFFVSFWFPLWFCFVWYPNFKFNFSSLRNILLNPLLHRFEFLYVVHFIRSIFYSYSASYLRATLTHDHHMRAKNYIFAPHMRLLLSTFYVF